MWWSIISPLDILRVSTVIITMTMTFADHCGALAVASSPRESSLPSKILIVGASGGTGLRALDGFLDMGYDASQLRVMTRSEKRASELAAMGFSTCIADLDSDDLTFENKDCSGCYIHSTSSDIAKLDTGETDRARNLAALLKASSIQRVVYNSAAAEPGHKVTRISQKHEVEGIFLNDAYFEFTALRANLFMEELWKHYTRPVILNKGKYPFSIPGDRKVYLTSVRDMGKLAGTLLRGEKEASNIINVASSELTPVEMAAAFGKAQNSPCIHKNSHFFGFLARLFFKDLYEVIQFYRTSTEATDIEALHKQFPGALTPFGTFLEETNWADPKRSYEDLARR